MRPLTRASRSDGLIVLGLIVLAVGLPAIIGIASGAIWIPHNDDFAYRRTALLFFETGRMELTGWGVMTLVGQIVATMPLLWLANGAAWAFAATGALFAIVGVVAGYELARRLLSPRMAGFAVLVAVVFPGFMLYTTTYMTDVPAFAMEMACLTTGAAALQRQAAADRWRWLAVSLAIGCYAFSIREFAIAAPLAVLAAAVSSERQGRRLAYVVAFVGTIGVCAAIYLYSSGLPGQGVPALGPPTEASYRKLLGAIAALCLTIAPALVIGVATWGPHWWRSRRRSALIGALGGTVVAGIVFLEEVRALVSGDLGGVTSVLVGNVFQAQGSLGPAVFAGTRPLLYVAPWWAMLNLLAFAATVVAFAFIGAALAAQGDRLVRALDLRRRPTALGSVPGLLLAFGVILSAGTIAVGLTSNLFDRYAWPLPLPFVILLLLRPSPEPATATSAAEGSSGLARSGLTIVAGTMVAVIATASLVLLLNADAFDAARWRIGEEAVRRGLAAETVDAGLEWVGMHATGLADPFAPRVPGMTPWAVRFSSFHQCAVASSTPLTLPGATLELEWPAAYRALLFIGPPRPMYLYRMAGPGCPA